MEMKAGRKASEALPPLRPCFTCIGAMITSISH